MLRNYNRNKQEPKLKTSWRLLGVKHNGSDKINDTKTTIYRIVKKGAKIRAQTWAEDRKVKKNWRSLAKGQGMEKTT